MHSRPNSRTFSTSRISSGYVRPEGRRQVTFGRGVSKMQLRRGAGRARSSDVLFGLRTGLFGDRIEAESTRLFCGSRGAIRVPIAGKARGTPAIPRIEIFPLGNYVALS